MYLNYIKIPSWREEEGGAKALVVSEPIAIFHPGDGKS